MKHTIMNKFIALFSLFLFQQVQGQDYRLIQFSGVVISGDSLSPIPFVNVIIKNTYRGTLTDFYGFYSFAAQRGDTILFSSLGFKPAHYVIPDTLSNDRYSLIQVLNQDTIRLNEVVISKLPSANEFKDAFMNLQIPNDDYQRAMYNLNKERMLEKLNAMDYPSASMSYKYQMQQYQNKLYNAGQLPPNQLLNPVAWAQFMEAWKRGDYKKKKK